jgi:hypothetical protein
MSRLRRVSIAAREFAEMSDLLMALLEAVPLVDDPQSRLTPETFVRHLGWCKARLVVGVLFPKVALAAPGSLHVERLTCGKLNCPCADGEPEHLHEAVHHVWWDGLRQRREYVPARLRKDMQKAIDRWRTQHQGDGRRSPLERLRKQALAAACAGLPHRRAPFTARRQRGPLA